MTGAEMDRALAGISENLTIGQSQSRAKIALHSVLFAEEVAEAGDGILGVLHELMLGLIPDVLDVVQRSVQSVFFQPEC